MWPIVELPVIRAPQSLSSRAHYFLSSRAHYFLSSRAHYSLSSRAQARDLQFCGGRPRRSLAALGMHWEAASQSSSATRRTRKTHGFPPMAADPTRDGIAPRGPKKTTIGENPRSISDNPRRGHRSSSGRQLQIPRYARDDIERGRPRPSEWRVPQHRPQDGRKRLTDLRRWPLDPDARRNRTSWDRNKTTIGENPRSISDNPRRGRRSSSGRQLQIPRYARDDIGLVARDDNLFPASVAQRPDVGGDRADLGVGQIESLRADS